MNRRDFIKTGLAFCGCAYLGVDVNGNQKNEIYTTVITVGNLSTQTEVIIYQEGKIIGKWSSGRKSEAVVPVKVSKNEPQKIIARIAKGQPIKYFNI